ncbi:MAG: hypothetical protein LBG43_09230 [Treponema sp.]|jgi:hypothetical protein|nr:hypothetical protein [Treponema sp.]
MKHTKKTSGLAQVAFVFPVSFILFSIATLNAVAEPMREGESLQPGRPLNQAPQSSGSLLIPEDIPEREPPQLPLTPPPEPIARRPPPAPARFDASPVFSRSVKAVVGQQVEIPFSGSGWVYLGEMNGQKGVAYSSHRLEKEGQSFMFIAEKSGDYALKFYKQDFIRDYTLNDHVQVIVAPAPVAPAASGYAAINRGAVVAEPRWPSAEQEAAIAEGAPAGAAQPAAAEQEAAIAEGAQPAAAEQPAGAAPVAVEASANATPDQFFKNAQAEFDAKNYAAVVSIVEQFRARYPNGADGDDEAWWLYAQACEANGPTKDIKTARYFYQRIVNEYPFSDHHSNARKRISYIDRYYMNIQ